MKITKKELRKIIREEILNESSNYDYELSDLFYSFAEQNISDDSFEYNNGYKQMMDLLRKVDLFIKYDIINEYETQLKIIKDLKGKVSDKYLQGYKGALKSWEKNGNINKSLGEIFKYISKAKSKIK